MVGLGSGGDMGKGEARCQAINPNTTSSFVGARTRIHARVGSVRRRHPLKISARTHPWILPTSRAVVESLAVGSFLYRRSVEST